MLISPWAINRSKRIWGPDAEEFKPERWLQGEFEKSSGGPTKGPFNLLTFLHGLGAVLGKLSRERSLSA